VTPEPIDHELEARLALYRERETAEIIRTYKSALADGFVQAMQSGAPAYEAIMNIWHGKGSA